MKLNLLPTTVSKERSSKTAWFGAGLIALLGIGLGVGLSILSIQQLKASKDAYVEGMQPAADVVATAAYGDEITADPRVVQLVKNVNLADAVIKHNPVYPDLYDRVLAQIPKFFRVTSLRAAPKDDKTATVTLEGALDSYTQYGDMVVALLRIPGATNVARQGYQLDPTFVPGLSEVDQTGRPRRQSDPGAIPDDPLERLAYLQGLAATQSFDNVGNFGGDDPTAPRGARPGSSAVVFTFDIPGDLRVPDVRASLAGGTAATPAVGGAALAGGAGAGGRAGGAGGDDR